ncbi:hypothetical protein ACIQYF_03615 [Pseudomonas sp. NPDC096917]|uniref:hypothetical protein n=1 Tax=Pseudomonas sp. NPDC096917 TaxID=3364483 RepID=UPI00383A3074
MDLNLIGNFAAIGSLGVSLMVLHQVKQLAQRVDAIETDRAWFTKKRDEQIEGLGADLYETKDLVKDLADFQKGDGCYRYDPDDPHLPAHIRDRKGRED